jgi:hypothetical protein
MFFSALKTAALHFNVAMPTIDYPLPKTAKAEWGEGRGKYVDPWCKNWLGVIGTCYLCSILLPIPAAPVRARASCSRILKYQTSLISSRVHVHGTCCQSE